MIKLRQVTSFMLDILMDCHERQLMKQAPVNYRTQHIKGLINRGYIKYVIATNEDTGKKELGFTITDQGKAFLARKFKNA